MQKQVPNRKIIVIHGSPKPPKKGVTAKYIEYLSVRYTEFDFRIHDVRQCIQHSVKLNELFEDLDGAYALIWETPVHVYLIPGLMQRFLHLVEETGTRKFKGLHATVITTSIRIFDHAAHSHLNYISHKLGMKFHKGYSAEMYDLANQTKRNNFSRFFELFVFQIKNGFQGLTSPVREFRRSEFIYQLPSIEQKLLKTSYNVVIIKDVSNNSSLNNMVSVLQSSLSNRAPTICFEDLGYIFPFCTGCVHCMIDKCNRSDNFYRDIIEPILNADILVFAIDIGEFGTSWRFEVILDRLLAAGHGPYLEKHPVVGFFTSGDLRYFHYLQDRFRGYFEQKGASTVEFVMPESQANEILTEKILDFARLSNEIISCKMVYPKCFLGKGSDFISRDFVYSMRGEKRNFSIILIKTLGTNSNRLFSLLY